MIKIDNSNFYNQTFGRNVKALTPTQIDALMDALQTCTSLKEVAQKTNLNEGRIRYFCKNKLGKKYVEIKRESIGELLNRERDNNTISKRLGIKPERAKIIRSGSVKVVKKDLIINPIKKRFKELWEAGLSIEEIANKTNSDCKTVFNYLASVARKKGPWVG